MRWAYAPVLLALIVGCSTGATPEPDRPVFDLQAHRGGLGLISENTLPAFAHALELGVSTLELDIQITEDGHPVVTHDRDPDPAKCADTAPAFPGDPEFPYVPGRALIRDLTLDQVRTLDCGSRPLSGYPEQRPAPGAKMPLLSEVFDLVRAYRAESVTLNIETKVEAAAPHETVPGADFARIVVHEIRHAGLRDQVTVQSFDWSTLRIVRELDPELPLVALTNGAQFLQEGVPGPSPWLGGLDIDDFAGSLPEKYVAAAAALGVETLAPVHGAPQDGSITDPGYTPFTTAELVDTAHRHGLRVVPWTVDDPATMAHLLGLGVDGIITNRPDVLRTILEENGYALPPPLSRH
ncbi:glycerophosphodiester phosphodiesterase family protein [Nocardia carnea]|uniref:glycerophosphodiester phosphodiesterase family protein n=1 Tax=Nocardia carnea TaxID=37328 RepID=UPI0024562BF8|nr:glycerophosphodiester phosphodiesterase family protein [Nocardia carnea]